MSRFMMMPAGKYWIGDPSYVFSAMNHKWHQLFDETDFFMDAYGELDDGKIKVWAESTAYGDGFYYGSNGFGFAVDSGLIGIVPQETVEYLNNSDVDSDYSGMFIEFSEPFEVEAHNGKFAFGHIIIDTGFNYDDDSE